MSVSYPADEHYNTPSAAFENPSQAVSKPRCLIDLNITNTSNGLLWLGIWDCVPAGGSNPAATSGDIKLLDVKPIAAYGWYEFSVHGGQDLVNGLWVGAYSTAALARAGGAPDGGAVLMVKCDFTASKVHFQAS